MAKKTYVLDTSVYLTDHNSIYSYKNNDIIVPLKVLEEIDAHKKRQDSVGTNARSIIRTLDSLRERGNLCHGVRLGKGRGIVSVCKGKTSLLPADLNSSHPDHVIISTALAAKEENPSRKIIVVTRDINMRVICDSLSLECEDYIHSQAVEQVENVYSGFAEHLVDDPIIDQFYEGEKIYIEGNFYPNQFVMLISNANEKKTALARYMGPDRALLQAGFYKEGVWGINPRNKEQVFAMDLLMDQSVNVITLVGQAGSGKTLCAIAAGLQQTLQAPSGNNKRNVLEPKYKRLIVSRPVQPLGRDIGFLPGSMEEKMSPWLRPIQDNLQFLMGNDRETLEMYMSKGVIDIEALTYIRGRSISNAFIIIDEAQNLTSHELKTIVTRVGENTKIVFTGDIEQIDNVYIDETTNGLTNAVEKFKHYDLSGHITLIKGERSKVATLGAKIL
tara:strand:+ start:556 stop:1890 length:1335 start_codon:yes stop_codon:yes gene_type:complete